jgi:DNA-binding MarR family transcriptional regulator
VSAAVRFDETIHAPHRLQITAMLAPVDFVEFATVRDAVGVSDSVLSKHVRTLEEAGYVKVTKVRAGSRIRTRLALTAAGRDAFAGHVAALQEIVAASTRS